MKSIQNLSSTRIAESGWLERELRHVDLGDKRLRERLTKTGNLMEGKASGSINESRMTWKASKGAYRLFSNGKFKANLLTRLHATLYSLAISVTVLSPFNASIVK